MNTNFVAQDVEWTEEMKHSVRGKIVEPLRRSLSGKPFDIAVHLKSAAAVYVMSVIVQTFDGQPNEIVRLQNPDFLVLVNEVSGHMRQVVRKPMSPPQRFFRSLKRLLPSSTSSTTANL